jgi:hypothetical protein
VKSNAYLVLHPAFSLRLIYRFKLEIGGIKAATPKVLEK